MKCIKIRYRDEISAKIALADCRRKDGSRRDRTECRIYQCRWCGGWHLTSASSMGKETGDARGPGVRI